jgi:hypothetical protein
MKKVLLVAAFIVAGFIGANAQKGVNKIGVGADFGIPTGDFGDLSKLGIGGYAKALFGIGTAGQITFTTGYTSFGWKDEYKDLLGVEKASFNVIPLMAGYRHNFGGFYAEPQVGYNIFGARAKAGGETESDSEGMFAWAIGFGYVVNNFDIGTRYHSMHKDGDSEAFVGIRIGYNFNLGGSTAKK